MRTGPERAADHGRALQQRLRRRRQPVDARGDQRLQRVRDPVERRSSPSSASIRTVSSTKSGLPSVLSSSVARGRARGARSPSSSASTQLLALVARSGSSSIAVARRRPPPQPGRTSSSSGRARQRIRSGASRTQVGEVLDQLEQRLLGPVDVLEDQHERLRAAASCSAHSRAAQAISCWLRSAWTASRTPDASPSRSATASSSQHVAQLLERLVERVVVGDPGGAT